MRFEFEAIGRICIPLLVVFFGFTSLLFNRARAFSKGRSRVRCMYAAERAFQATMFAFLGLLLGTGMYALFVIFGFAPNQVLEGKHAWLLLFFLPHLLIQTSVVCFLLAFRTIAIEFLGPLSPRTIRQRLKDGL